MLIKVVLQMKKIGNVFILGDSYSTFDGCIADGCGSWYCEAEQESTDVSNLNETWWDLVLNNTDSNLILNCSSSGTTICHTGYNGADCSKKDSFCARLNNLIEKGFFKKNNIDTFFIFGGTNDSWADSPLGEIKYGPKTKEELFSVLPAFCYLIETVKSCSETARIITIVNTDLKKEISDCFEMVTKHYGAEIIKLNNIEKQNGHPNKAGMQQIYNQVLNQL